MGWLWWNKSEASKKDLGLDKTLQEYLENPDASKGGADTAHKLSREAPMKSASGQRDRTKTLRQIAMDNCVEYEMAYSKCLKQGPMWDRLQSCPYEQATHEKCKEMQEYALSVLGFRTAASDEAKMSIKARADDIMIATVPTLTISEAQVAAFYKSVDSAASPDS